MWLLLLVTVVIVWLLLLSAVAIAFLLSQFAATVEETAADDRAFEEVRVTVTHSGVRVLKYAVENAMRSELKHSCMHTNNPTHF